jgi:WD40 repeat protein/serine/threonine protein kinase
MNGCPAVDRLEQFLEGRLEGPDGEELSAHIGSCRGCQEALERLTEAPVSLRVPLSPSRRSGGVLSRSLRERLEAPPSVVGSSSQVEAPAVPGYEILSELGRGGMGVVYRARHVKLNRTVALKMILAGVHAGPRELARFRQEAEAVAQLHHPNIVQIFDVGEANGHAYCALELVEGGSLARYMRQPGPPEDVARLIEMLARTIHYAHQAGIVHRDLKPANVLMHFPNARQDDQEARSASEGTLSGRLRAPAPSQPLSDRGERGERWWERGPEGGAIPKITDFGLAKRLDEQANATLSGELVGTPSYMAPEQAAGRARRVGPLVDVHALGAILYEMLTGHPPFKGATAVDTVLQVLHEEPVRLSRLRPDVPRDLETICLKCLEKNPNARYGSALELAEDLRRFRRGDVVLARPAGPQERLLKWVRRRPAMAGLVASIVLIAALGFAGVTWQWRETARARDDALQANLQARAALYQSVISQSQLRWRLNDFAGARASLERFDLDGGPDEVKSWEWGFLENLYASDLFTLEHAEGSSAGGVAVSADGKYIASAVAGQGSVLVWQAADGELAFALDAAPGAQRLAFSPDSGTLAVADTAGGVTLWDLPPGGKATQKSQYQFHSRGIVGLAFSPDGKWLATASWDWTVKVSDAAIGTPRYEALRHDERVHCLSFSPDGRWLATGDQAGHVRLFDFKTGALAATLEGHKSAVYGVAFSPDGKTLASAGSNGNLRLWDLVPWRSGRVRAGARRGNPLPMGNPATRPAVGTQGGKGATPSARTLPTADQPRIKQSLASNAGAALGIAFSPDGRYLAAGCSDATARVWTVGSGMQRVIFRGHTAPVEAVRFSPDGRRLFSCCPEQGAVKAWDLTRPAEFATLARTRHPEYPGQNLMGTWPEVKVWDLLRGSSGPTQASTGPDVEALAFQDEGRRLVSVTVGGRLQTWETASGLLLDERPLPLYGDLVSPAVLANFSADGRLLAARRNEPGDQGRVAGIWDTDGVRLLATLKGHRYPLFGVRFSADGRRLATVSCDRASAGRPHEVKVWDSETGRLLRSWEGSGHIFVLAFSPDGKWLATGGENGLVKVLDWEKNRTVFERREHKGAVTALAFGRDGQALASAGAGDQSVKVIETGKWRVKATAEAPGVLCDLAFSRDGRRLAGISRDELKLWDVASGQELLALRGAPQRHRDPSFNPRLAFSPDGRLLAGSNWDESISVWESESPSPALREARRRAAERRAGLWHLQEAERCVLFKNEFGRQFHVARIGTGPLPPPLRDRRDHLLRQSVAEKEE